MKEGLLVKVMMNSPSDSAPVEQMQARLGDQQPLQKFGASVFVRMLD